MSEVGLANGELTAVEQAAVLLLSLGESESAMVLKHLEPREIQRVGSAMSAMPEVSTTQVANVLDTFLNTVTGQSGLSIGAGEYMRRMLVSAMGERKGSALHERILGGNSSGLEKLKWMDARGIADFIRNEHPQIQAVILSYLEPSQSAEVLNYFTNEEARIDALIRVASLDTVPPAALKELNSVLEREVSEIGSSRISHLGGSKAAADIMNNLGSVGEEIMEGIREVDETLGDEISDLMLIFENLLDVADRDFQTVLREISTDSLMLALKGAEETMREKVFSNMSSRAAELLKDDMEARGPVRISEVEEAQKEILGVARRLADAGEIQLGNSAEEMV